MTARLFSEKYVRSANPVERPHQLFVPEDRPQSQQVENQADQRENERNFKGMGVILTVREVTVAKVEIDSHHRPGTDEEHQLDGT